MLRFSIMGFPDRGEKNLTSSTSSCKNFQPNMFNKTKCQNCFRTREAHALNADDGNQKPKKVVLCSYLYLAPGIDFDNPLSKSRKWQRRCFIFYEDGTLCYALDDNPNTIPQGIVNMYQCTNVFDAAAKTGKDHSMGIVTPDETTYIRAETREEKDSWYNALAEYPEINKQEEKMRQKRAKARSYGGQSSKEIQPDKPRVESTTIAVTAKPPVESSESQSPEGNEPATQDRVSHSDMQGKGSSDSSSSAQNRGTTGLRRSQSETTTNRPRRYHEIIDTNAPSLGGDGDNDSNSLNSPDALRKHSTPLNRKLDEEKSEKSDSEKNKARHRRLRSDGTPLSESKRSGKRSRYHTIEVLATPERVKEVDKENREVVIIDENTNSQNSALHRNNNNVNIESPVSNPETNKPVVETAPLATQEDLDVDVDFEGRPRTLSDLSSHSSEDLERMDNPRKSRLGLRLNKAMLDHSDSPSPSKRTIERRRHAHDRRSRHTLDGSMHVMIPSSDDSETSKDAPSLKRSNSDPNLADSEDMLKRKQIAMTFPGLFHLKKGWLIKQGDVEQDFSKHWFVLCDNKLSYYKDSTDEDPKNLDGVIDLSKCHEARETPVSRNYGFQIKTADGIIILAAMTRGIRDNWVQAINKALVTAQEDKAKENIGSTPSSEDNRSVEEALVKKESSPILESPISIASTDSISEGSAPERTFGEKKVEMRRASSQREKGRERRSRRSSRDLKEMKRLSNTGLDSTDTKGTNGSSSDSRLSSRGTSSSPVHQSGKNISDVEKENSVPKASESSSPSRSSSMKNNTAVMELLETEVESLKSQLENVQRECMRTQKDNTELRALMNAVNREHKDNYQDLENEHTAYITQIEQLAERQDELLEKNKKFEVQNQRLQMEVKQSKNKVGLLQQQKEQLNERLNSSIVDLEEKEKECEDLQERLQAVVSEFAKNETEITKTQNTRSDRNEAMDKLNKRIALLENELTDSRTREREQEERAAAESRANQEMQQNVKDNENFQIVETELVHMLRMQLQESQERLQESEQDCISNEERFEKRYTRLEAKHNAEKIAVEEKLEEAEAIIKTLSAAQKEERISPNRMSPSRMSPSRTNFDGVLPLSPLPPDASVEEIGQKLGEREQQLMELRRQLKKEVTAKSVLQEKYDDIVTKYTALLQRAEVGEDQASSVDSSAVSRLEEDLSGAKTEIERLGNELEREQASGKAIHEKLAAESMAKSELADKFKSLYKLAQKQQEELKMARAVQGPDGAHKVLSERNAIIMKLQDELRKQVAEKNNLNKSVHTLSGDLATFQAQLAGKDQDVLKLKEQLTEGETQNTRLKQVLQANVTQITALKQQLGGLEGMRDELRHLQSQIEKEKGSYTVELQNKEDQLTNLTHKLGNVQAELKSLETKLREAEEASTLIENKFEKQVLDLETDSEEMQKKVDRSDKEIKRLRNELKTSQSNYDELELQSLQSRDDVKRLERTHAEQMELMGQRIQDLTNKLGAAERKVRDLQNMEQKARLVRGGSSRASPVQAAMLENQLKEVEMKLGDVQHTIENQDKQTNNLQGKIVSVEKQVEAREAEPSSSERSSPSLVARDSTPSPLCESLSTSCAERSEDTDSTSSQEGLGGSTDSQKNATFRVKFLESKLGETERKLKEVTRKLVDITTRQLVDRKANQARRAAENKLKERVKQLEGEVEELKGDLEKANENVTNSSPTVQIAREHPGGNHNVMDRHSAPSTVYANVSPFMQHDLDSEKFVEKAMFLSEMQTVLSLLMNMQRSIDGTKDTRRMSASVLFERNEILSNGTLFQAETNLVQHKSCQSNAHTKKSCHKSEPVYASIVPRSARLVRRMPSRVTVRKKPIVSSSFDAPGSVDEDDSDYSLVMPRRHSDPAELGVVSYTDNSPNSKELVVLHRKWIGTVDILKEKYEAVLKCVKAEKDTIIQRLGQTLALSTLQQKSEENFDEMARKNKSNGIDSTLEELVGGWDAELAAYAEEIAFHEAMSIAMDYVSNEIVLAEAMQGLHTRSKQLHEIIEAESESCSKVLNLFKHNAAKRYECLQKGLEDTVIVTGEEVRQSYYDRLARIQTGVSDSGDLSKDCPAGESLNCLIGTLADMMLTLAVVDGIVDYLCQEGCEVGLENQSNVGIVTDLDIMDGIPSPRTPSPCELADDVDLIDLTTEAEHPVAGSSSNVSSSRDSFAALQGCMEQAVVSAEAEDIAILLADKAIAHAEAVYMTDCVQEEWDRTVEAARMSVMETITAEHAHNIATVREKYEIAIREQREVHTSELASLQEKYNFTLLKICDLEEEFYKVAALHANKPDIAITMVQDVDKMVEEMMANKMQRIEADMEATRIRLKEARIQLEIQSEEHIQEVHAITGIMETMEKKYKEELDALRAQYIGRVEELERDMRRRMDRQRETHEQELVEAVRRHRQDLARMTEEHHTALADQVRSNGELMEQEKSHREQLSEIRDTFHSQLKGLHEEKDKQLHEEAQATAKVIASIQEKHEQELEQERLNLQSSVSSDVESVMKRHREIVSQMNKEWQILSQKFSQVCQENTQLSKQVEKLTTTLGEGQLQTEKLLSQNRELSTQLTQEVLALSKKVEGTGEEEENEEVLQVDRNDNEQVTPMKVALHIREVEIDCANEELSNMRTKLTTALEKEKASEKSNYDLEVKCQSYQDYIEALKGEVDDLQRQVQRVRTSGEGAAAQDDPTPEVV